VAEPLTPYTRGIFDLGEGCWAWLEPPGHWGLANSGVVVGRDETLVVDTQNDLPMAAALKQAVGAVAGGAEVTTVVNTHGDGDHWNGNLLFDDAKIIATEATVAAMHATWLDPTSLREQPGGESALERFLAWRASVYRYESWRPVYPDETFTVERVLDVGGSEIQLLEVGPAHSQGDTIVHVPEAGVVFAGDVLFSNSTPIIWAGPMARCIAACDRIVGLEPRVVVPGHGPVIAPSAIREVREYYTFVKEYARQEIAAGREPREAYERIDLGTFASWPHASRVYQNLYVEYHEHDSERFPVSIRDNLEVVLGDDDGSWTAAVARPRQDYDGCRHHAS
jgi:glyoxylase-like metal-dependent hydrolase (beta-lactamase superfamily II)